MNDLEAMKILLVAAGSYNSTEELCIGLDIPWKGGSNYAPAHARVREAKDYVRERLKHASKDAPGYGRF